MGLCISGMKTNTVADLKNQLQTTLDGPLKIVVPPVDEYADMPSLMDIRNVITTAAVAALDAVDAADSAVANIKSSVQDAVDKAVNSAVDSAVEDMPALIQATTNEIKELDITLNKLNRQIFGPM